MSYINNNHGNSDFYCLCSEKNTDFGPEPYVVNIEQATCGNKNFRTALWTGNHLQLTLMNIPTGGEVGLEIHNDTDQFLRIESGRCIVKMGSCKDNLNFHKCAGPKDGIFIPSGKWHNIINTGACPLKLYSVYAPPKHPRGTVHQTKEIAEIAGD